MEGAFRTNEQLTFSQINLIPFPLTVINLYYCNLRFSIFASLIRVIFSKLIIFPLSYFEGYFIQ